jgi:hypothetical protein
MFKMIKNAILITVGIISLIVGIIGVLLPVIPGSPFLLVAFLCLILIED